ncbi:hypothetical protein FF1_002070 [Malus domestica]
MEASQPLSIESFSYSWLVNLKPASLESLDNSVRTSLDAYDEASFIEMDPTMPPSQRFFMNSQQDFKFDFPAAISQSPLTTLVHADELISNGYVLPLSVESLMKMEAYHRDEASNSSPLPSHLQKDAAPTGNHNSRDCSKSLRRCRRLSRRIFEKYLNFLRPLYKRIRGDHNHQHKANPKGGNLDKRSHSVKNCRVRSSEISQSPRISVAYSADDWRMSCDSESSIYEAVIHCKRSIGMKLNGLRDAIHSRAIGERERKKNSHGKSGNERSQFQKIISHLFFVIFLTLSIYISWMIIDAATKRDQNALFDDSFD